MANFLFNISKGRFCEFWYRVKNNDPANSAILLIPLTNSGTITEADRQDDATVTAFLAEKPDEVTTGGWTRGTLTDSQLGAVAPDLGNNRFAGTVPTFTWTAPSAGTTTGLLIAYDSDTTSGTDANVLPISHHDFSVIADGNNVVLNAGTAVYAA